METDPVPGSPARPNLRLQATTFPGYPASSLSPSFKLDEGYSDDTRSQPDKELMPENVMMLPDWVLSQSESDRAGRTPLWSFGGDCGDFLSIIFDFSLSEARDLFLYLLHPLTHVFSPRQNSHTAFFVHYQRLHLSPWSIVLIHCSTWTPLSSSLRN